MGTLRELASAQDQQNQTLFENLSTNASTASNGCALARSPFVDQVQPRIPNPSALTAPIPATASSSQADCKGQADAIGYSSRGANVYAEDRRERDAVSKGV